MTGGSFDNAFGPSFDPPTFPAPVPGDPYGVSIEAVHALVPYRRLDVPASNAPPGTATVSAEDIDRWIADLSQSFTARLMVIAGATDIFVVSQDGNTTVLGGAPGSEQRFAIISGIARDAITNGAASYWEAAMNPERQGVNDTTYAGVLWARYTAGIAAAETLMSQWLSQGEIGDGGDGGGIDGGGIMYPGYGWITSLFPVPAFPDDIRW